MVFGNMKSGKIGFLRRFGWENRRLNRAKGAYVAEKRRGLRWQAKDVGRVAETADEGRRETMRQKETGSAGKTEPAKREARAHREARGAPLQEVGEVRRRKHSESTDFRTGGILRMPNTVFLSAAPVSGPPAVTASADQLKTGLPCEEAPTSDRISPLSPSVRSGQTYF